MMASLQFRESERAIFFVSLPLMLAATMILAWLAPFPILSKLIITALCLAGATYGVLAYWLFTRKRLGSLRYATPFVSVGMITTGIIAVSGQTQLGFILYFPAVIFSSIRAGRRIGLLTTILAVSGYALTLVLHPYPTGWIDFLFIVTVLFIIATLSGAMSDEERNLRRQARERRGREQAALLKISDALSEEMPDWKTTISTAAKIATETLNADAAMLVMREGERLTVQVASGLLASYNDQDFIIPSSSISATAIALGKPVSVSDYHTEWALEHALPVREQNFRSGLAVPMMRGAQTLGAFLVLTLKPRVYTEDETHLLTLLANQMLVAIEGKLAREKVHREGARAQALARAAVRLNVQLDLNTVLKEVCEECAHAFDAPVAMVSLYDQAQKALYLAADYGLPPEFHKQMQPLPSEIYGRYVSENGSNVVIPDVQAIPDLPDADLYIKLNIRTMVGASMLHHGQLLGRLNIGNIGQVRHWSKDELALLGDLANQAAAAVANSRVFDQTQQRAAQLSTLNETSQAMSSLFNAEEVLEIIYQQAQRNLPLDIFYICLYDENTKQISFPALYEEAKRFSRPPTLLDPQTILGRAILMATPQMLNRSTLELLSIEPVYLFEDASKASASLLFAPLVAESRAIGAISVQSYRSNAYTSEHLTLLTGIARQAANAIENALLYDDLWQSNVDLGAAFDQTIEGWVRALDLRDNENEGHSRRVAELVCALAREYGMSEEDLAPLRRGALLHDIGKMEIPDGITLKSESLTEDEMFIIRKHPAYAFDILSPIRYLHSAMDIPCCHHEKWDGTGYPRRLRGEKIPLAARLFAVVDVWDALTSDRPYRKAWPESRAREYIQSLAGKHFDPKVVQVFLRVVAEKKN